MQDDINNGMFIDDESANNTQTQNVNNSDDAQTQTVSADDYNKAMEKLAVYEREMTQTRQELAEIRKASNPQPPVNQEQVDEQAIQAAERLRKAGVVDQNTLNATIGTLMVNLTAKEFAKNINAKAEDKRLEVTEQELAQAMMQYSLFDNPQAAYRILRGDIKDAILEEKLAKADQGFNAQKKNINTIRTSVDSTAIDNADTIKDDDYTLANAEENVLKEFEAMGI